MDTWIENIMLKVCAPTAIIEMEELRNLGTVVIKNYMLKDTVKTVILISIIM